MSPDRLSSPQGQQHDDHCATKEIHEWKPWPPATDTEFDALLEKATIQVDPLYVIAKSDSVEHLYWSAKGWGPLKDASRYSRDTLTATPEPKHAGFWMDIERAQELEA